MDVLYIILRYSTWRFRICYLFREIFKFRQIMDINIFFENHKNVNKSVKLEYFEKVIAYSRSPDHVLQNYVY